MVTHFACGYTIEEFFGALNLGLSIESLSASIYLNTVYGHEFWKSQPNRYPDKYYNFMSTKFRLNISIGQQVTWQIPAEKRRHHQSISLFYELNTCDLYLRARILVHPLKDIIGLSLGVKLFTMLVMVGTISIVSPLLSVLRQQCALRWSAPLHG